MSVARYLEAALADQEDRHLVGSQDLRGPPDPERQALVQPQVAVHVDHGLSQVEALQRLLLPGIEGVGQVS
jgi:hypothetical protein